MSWLHAHASIDPKVATAYRKWWAGLTREEKKSLIASGAFKADDPAGTAPSRSRVNDTVFDFSEVERRELFRSSGNNWDMPLTDEQKLTPPDALAAAEDLSTDPRIRHLDLASIRLRATLHFILRSMERSTDPSMKLDAEVIRIVVGEGQPPKMADLARRHGVTKSAVSQRCCSLLRQLGLEPSRFMRPRDEVQSMRVSAILRAEGIALSPASLAVQARNRRVKGARSNSPNPHPPGKESP